MKQHNGGLIAFYSSYLSLAKRMYPHGCHSAWLILTLGAIEKFQFCVSTCQEFSCTTCPSRIEAFLNGSGLFLALFLPPIYRTKIQIEQKYDQKYHIENDPNCSRNGLSSGGCPSHFTEDMLLVVTCYTAK